jgi:hypothetical protein
LLDAEKYLHALRVPNAIIDEMFAKASSDIHWLSEAELEQLGLRPPWYEEVLVARCGLKARGEFEEIDAFGGGNIQAHSELKAVLDCAANLTYPDAERSLNAALARYNKEVPAPIHSH